jgi:hypothetical protein
MAADGSWWHRATEVATWGQLNVGQPVEPLERMARWEEGEVPETFPSAV